MRARVCAPDADLVMKTVNGAHASSQAGRQAGVCLEVAGGATVESGGGVKFWRFLRLYICARFLLHADFALSYMVQRTDSRLDSSHICTRGSSPH